MMNKEFLEKAKDCKSIEEIKELAEKENIELTDEELEEIAGGIMPGEDSASYTAAELTKSYFCPNCLTKLETTWNYYLTCNNCGFSESLADPNPKSLNYDEYMKCKQSEGSGACITSEAYVTLANGNQVAVKDLKGNEELLIWDFINGKQDKASILLIEKKEKSEYDVINLSFSDGSQVGVIYEHGFYDVDLCKYVYLDKNANQYIGHRFDRFGKAVELVKVEIKKEIETAYSPITYGHVCFYVHGMLSVTGGVDGMLNYFDIDSDSMKYNEKAMQADIEKYGLFTYDEFAEIVPVPKSIFNGMNCKYMKIAIGKGLVTLEKLKEYAEAYAVLFDNIELADE